MMGFDAKSFDIILVKFGPMFSGHTPFHHSGMIVDSSTLAGEKEKFSPRTALGLC